MDENEALPEQDDVSDVESKKRRFPGLGILFAIIACLFFAVGSIVVKLTHDLGGISLSIARFSVQFILLLPLITYHRKEVDVLGLPGLRKFLYMRGVFGALCVPTLYLSIQRMDVGDAITIAYTSTIMLPIFARIILKERLTILEVILGLAALSGIILIARPSFIFQSSSFDSVDELGVLFGLLGAVCQSLSMITIRKLGKTDAALNITYFSICGCVICVPILFVLHETAVPCSGELPYVFSLGILGIIGQVFLTLALRCERAATVAVARSVQVIFAYVLQILVLGQIPSMLSLIGSGIIFSCCIILGTTKVLKDMKRNAASK